MEAELIAWGESQSDVRAIVLTSTRAIPDARIDHFSDYDVIVIGNNIQHRFTDRSWLEDFGEVVIDWWDPLEVDAETGFLTTGNIVYYHGTRKIDFTLWPVEMAAKIAVNLPQELDAGYRVLLDKDALTREWAAASGKGYAISLPDCDTYREAVRSFYIGVPYVVTALLRHELLPAKWVLDYDMRYEYLLPMLEWYAVTIHGPNVRIGNHGKWLLKLMPPEFLSRWESTYAGFDAAANRAALTAMVSLYKDVAIQVANAIGCEYPEELHHRVMQHIETLEHTEMR